MTFCSSLTFEERSDYLICLKYNAPSLERKRLLHRSVLHPHPLTDANGRMENKPIEINRRDRIAIL